MISYICIFGIHRYIYRMKNLYLIYSHTNTKWKYHPKGIRTYRHIKILFLHILYMYAHETKTVAISTNHPMIMRNFHIHVWILFTEIKRKRFAQFALSFTPNQITYWTFHFNDVHFFFCLRFSCFFFSFIYYKYYIHII